MKVHPEVMRKMRAYAIKQALSEIKNIEDKQTVEHIAKRHGLGYGELKQAYAKALAATAGTEREVEHETTQ